MAVAFDTFIEEAGSTVLTISVVSNLAFTPGTVGANSNRVMILALVCRNDPGAITAPPSWNGVAGTLINSANTGGNGFVYLYGIKGDANIATGNQTLAAVWTNTTVASLMAWSWYNADQTTGWRNFNPHQATDAALTVEITSTSGNAVSVAAFDDDASSGTFSAGGASFTSDVHEIRFQGNYHGAHALSNGSTITMTGTLGDAKLHIEAGVDVIAAGAATSAALTGTATASITETDIRAGGKTVILTLTGDTYVAAGTGPIGSIANTQALIDGIDSAQSGINGWDARVRPLILMANVVRTSNTVATITLPVVSGYDVSAQETITATIPAAVLTGAAPIVASPTFTIDTVTEQILWAQSLL